MIVEGLEDRRLLATARFDFDSGTPETGPTGWTHIAAANAFVETTDPSGIGIKFTGTAPIGYSATYVAGTVPADANGLGNGINRAVNAERVTFVLTNLDRLKSYEIWVLGGNNAGTTQTQQVTVEGAQGIQSFNQTIANLNLGVNSAVGDSTKAVTDFAPILVPSPLHDDLDDNGIPDTYAVRVAVIRSGAFTAAHAAGVVIREFIPSFTLPASGGPFSLVAENGNRVVKNSGGAALATLPNTGPIIVNGTDAANDVLNVNLTSGNPLTGGVTFNGGPGGNDRLMLTGGSQGTATYNYTNANAGSVELSNFGTIAYTGLEPIVNTGTALDVILNLPATSDVAFLEDNGATASDGMLRLRSSPTSFELTDFATPGGSITVNLGAGNDTFTVSALPQFNAALTINGGTGNDTINLNTSITFGSGKNLTIDLQDDDAAPGLDTINVGTGVALNLSGSGAATMKSSRGIAFGAASSLVTASGPIMLAANQQPTPSSGNFIGIDILGATIKSGSGDISLMGRGGTGSAAQVGVYIHSAALVGDITTGAVTISGRGGDTPAGSAGGNAGVLVEDISKVSTAGGNIAITGAGGTDATNAGLNHGVTVDQSKVNAGAFGTLTIIGTGTGAGSFGIQVALGPEALKTVSGKMTLNGTGETGVFTNGAEIISAADIEITGTATVAVNPGIRQAGNLLAASSGNIKLIADQMDLQQTVDAGLGTVTLVPKTAGRAINLGTDDSPAQLGILDVEQSVIAAATLNIGDANSGQITVSSNIVRPTAAIVTNLNLISSGAILFTGGLIDSAGGNVTLTPGNAAAASFARLGTDLALGAGTLAFGAGADASFVINGTVPDTGHQVLNVAGNVNLTGAEVVVSGSHMPAFGATFAIVKYTGGRTGTFANATAMLNGQTMTVVYDDANKQVLLRAPEPPSLTATLIGGDLTITDTNAPGKNNQLTVSAAGGNLVITEANESFVSPPAGGTLSNGNRTLTIPLASVTGSLIINSAGGNDTLTLDYTTGNIAPPVTFNGGTQTDVPGDRLKLTGGSFSTVTHNFTSASGGTIILDGASVTYTGLEPVDMGGLGAANLIFNLPAASSTAFLEDDGASGNTISQFRSSNGTFETTTFSNPSGSLTINRGNAADTLTVNALPNFTAGLAIASEVNPLASVTFGGAFTLAADKNLSANSSNSISLTTTFADLATSGDGSISLTAARDIRLVAGSSITTVNGSLLLSANQQAVATTGNFKGIDVENATIQATGTGAVTIRGKAGNDSDGFQHGVQVRSGGLVKGGSGGLQVIGQGGGSGDSGLNVGVLVNTAAQLSAAGTGAVVVQGTGGTGTANSHLGVWINDAGSMITSSGGNVQITGQGGGSGASGFNLGVDISSSAQVSAGGTGTVTVQGTGGAGSGQLSHGVYINGNSAITSSGGNVQVTGQGGSSAASRANSGVFIDSSQITAGGNGAVTVMGTGGAGSGDGNNGVFVAGTGSAIISGGGNVQVTGLGGGSAASSFNNGVIVFTSGLITAGGSGTVVVQGTGGAGSGSLNAGVSLSLTGASITSSGGNVHVTGIEGAGTSGLAISASSGAISTAANGGNLTLTGNSVSIGASATIGAAAANSVTLRQFTNGVPINLGLASDSIGGPLALSDGELDRITAGQIIIGDLNSGAVTFSAPISLANSSTLSIITGGSINDAGSSTVFTDTNLSLNAAAGIGTTTPLNIAVSSLAASGASGGVNISNTGDVNVTTVGGVVGAAATGFSVRIASSGAITVDKPITATLSGGIELSATSGITLNDALVTSGGNVTLTADSDANGTGTLTLSPAVLAGLSQQELTAADGAAGDQFGASVAISSDGNTAIVGAHRDAVGANASQGSAYVFIRTAGVWTQQQQLTIADGATGDGFGASVALSSDGNTAIIGAFEDDVGANVNQGSAYVFTRTGGAWTQQQQLTATDGEAVDTFGIDVALSSDGNTAIVGAALDGVGANVRQGSAYVFTRTGGVWTHQQQLTAADGAAGDLFGGSVALSSDGNTAIVGASNDDVGANTFQGSAYVFTRTGSAWTQQQQLTADDGAHDDFFGGPVALSSDGNTAIVAASNDDVGANAHQGSAYVFIRTSGVWTQQQKLTATDGAANDRFGFSVALSSDGNMAIVGALNDDVGANVDQGSASVFTRAGGIWTQQQQFAPADPATDDNFGRSAALSSDGNTAIVGTTANQNQGSAFAFMLIPASPGGSIAAAGGNVVITAAGAVVGGPISTSGSGGLNLTATGGGITADAALTAGTGGVTLTADNGIQLATAAADITSSGPIDINADFDANDSGMFSSVAGAKIDQTGTDIPVTVTASDIALNGTIDSSGILTIQPSTSSRSIALNDNAGSFRLDSGEITRAGANNGGRYTIGRLDGTGDIRIAGNGSLQLPAGDFSLLGGNVGFNGRLLMAATGPALEIVSSGDIQQAFSGNAIQGATTLILDSAEGVGALTNPLRVAAGQSLAARASVNGPVAIASTDSLTSRALGSINGITTNGGPIQLEAFNFRVGLTGIGLGPINAGAGSVSITATAPTFTTTGSLTINDAISGGANSTLSANSLFLNASGSVNVGTAKLTIQPDSDLPIDLGGADSSGAALGLTNAELDRIVAGTLVVGDIPFSGQITITAPINVADNATPIPTLHLASVGGIIDANATGPDLTVANLALEAFSGDDVSNRLTTLAVTLAASTVGAGDVLIDNLGPLTVTAVDGRSGVSANGGIVELTAAGPLTINSPIGATGGDIALTAAGDDQLLSINASVSGVGGAVFTADKMRFVSTINFGFGKLILVPESVADSGDAIVFAATSTAGPDTLAFTDDEFFISAGEIQIGDSQSGPITIASDFTAFPAINLNLVSGGPINFVGGPLNTGGGNLTLTPGGAAGAGFAKAGTDVNVGPDNTLAFAAGTDLNIALSGLAVDTQYQQLNVVGQVDLTGVDFVPSLGFSPPAGSQFTIVSNDGADPVIGEFNGLPDAGLFFIAGVPQARLAQISYSGGDGNDVILNFIDPTDPVLSGTSGDDSFLVRRVATDVEIFLNGASLLTTPFASLTRIRLDSLAGNDTLTVDLTGGDPIPAGGIAFAGGAPAIAPGDSLIIAGGIQGTVTYNYTNATDGSVVMANFGTVTYTGLEPIQNTGLATDIIFNLPAGTNNLTLADDGTPGNVLSRLSGPTIETTDFFNPTGSLTINRGSASDSLTIAALPDFTASLSLGSAAAPLASVLISGGVNFAANKNLSINASQSITLSTAASDLVTSGTGSISLTAARNIALTDGSSLTVANGNLTLSANQQNPATPGDFVGVLIGNATVQSTGTGQVTILGRSGSSASGGQLFGVLINSGGQVLGGTSGVLRIEGIGGDSNGSVKSGVRLTNPGSLATTAGADVLIIGTGGAGGAFNRGVELFGGAVVSAGGAGEVLVFGTGGLAPGNENQGVLVNGVGTTITSTSGNVTIDGLGGGMGASVFNGGVVAVSSGSFGAGGSGGVLITGTAGNPDTASNGLSLLNVTTAGGNIDIIGVPQNPAAIGANFSGNVVTGPGGTVQVFADRIAIAAGGSINAGTESVSLRPLSPGQSIDLGGPDSATTLGLSDTELDAIIAARLQIGDTVSGAINITADITRPALTDITLFSGGSIHFLTGSLSTAGGSLFLAPAASAVVTVSNDANDANLSPTGTLAFAPGSDLSLSLNGPTVDTDYHQLNVTGSVDLTGVDLVLSPAVGLPGGSTFIIVNNDGVDPMLGQFNGLADGALIVPVPGPGAQQFKINYSGGDGNDVALTLFDPRNPQIQGTSGDDNFLVRRSASDLEVRLNGTLIFSNAFADTNFLLLDGLEGNDTLNVDLTAGDAVPDGAGISFIGGASTAAGDNLSILGGNQGNVSYFYDDFPTGLVTMSNIGPINFLGLESILNTGTATDATINLFGPGGTFTLADDGIAGNNLTRIIGSGIVRTDFTNPTNSLTINPGNPADSLTINSLPDFNSTLTMGSAGAPLNNVTFAGAITLALNHDISVQAAGSISLPNDASQISTSGTGAISLTTTRNIFLGTGAEITSNDGAIALSANQQTTPTSGNFVGILASGATIQSTGAGEVILQGKGGDHSGGSQHGMRMQFGALIEGGTSGLQVIGRGGTSIFSGSNIGVLVENSSELSAAGSGVVNVQGFGGPGSGGANEGILVKGSGSAITSSGGDVQIRAVGASFGSLGGNYGLHVDSDALIHAGGVGAVRINANGGDAGGVFNVGVRVSGFSTISSNAGDLDIVGVGGPSDTASNSFGVELFSGQLSAGGNGAVRVTGFGGSASGSANHGIWITSLSEIASAGGDIRVVGSGNGNEASSNNFGILVQGRIFAAGTGDVELQGFGDGLGSGNIGVSVSSLGASISSAGGTVQITGVEVGGASSTGISISTGQISTSIGGGPLTLISNSMILESTATVSAGASGTVTLRPFTTGVGINLGLATDPTGGPLGLTDTELDQITAGTLQIGNFNSGPVTISSDITRAASTNINLTSGSFINFTTGSIDTAGGDLSLTPGATSPVGVANDANDAVLSSTGTLSFAPGTDLAIAINGLTVDTQHDQLNVAGIVDLIGVDLVLSGSFAPAVDDSFVIVANDGANPIVGTFNGLDDNEIFTVPSGPLQGNFRIVYTGGDGNDVVLTAVNAAPSFVAGIVPPANDESGPVTVPFATSILLGPPRESAQQPTFQILDNTNPDLFAVPPAIDEDGNLTFTPEFNVAGQALITVVLKDNGGTANGGSDTSSQVVFAIDVAKARVWHNAKIRLDVTGDNFRTADDALGVINFLNAFSSQPVPTDGRPIGPYYDTDGDGTVTANDALDVINFLNAFGADGEGEGESSISVSLVPTSDFRPLTADPLPPDLLTLLAADLATQPRRRR